MKLNIGCGKSNYPGYINIDMEPSVKPDLIMDIRKDLLPYRDGCVDEILFIHTIEHIEKRYHYKILTEFRRVLSADGKLIIAYPEFLKCVENYKNNVSFRRDFWEATIYGRQLYPGDYHISLMDSELFVKELLEYGFDKIKYGPEPYPNEYNTILTCQKNMEWTTIEDLRRKEVYGTDSGRHSVSAG